MAISTAERITRVSPGTGVSCPRPDGQHAWEAGFRTVLPTRLRFGPHRYFVYSADGREPPHVHVERNGRVAKFWLSPVRLQDPGGFSGVELNRIRRTLFRHRAQLLGAWREYFDT
jgi:hypothetical protein